MGWPCLRQQSKYTSLYITLFNRSSINTLSCEQSSMAMLSDIVIFWSSIISGNLVFETTSHLLMLTFHAEATYSYAYC